MPLSLGWGPTLIANLLRATAESLQSNQDWFFIRLVYPTDLSGITVDLHHSVWAMEGPSQLPRLTRLLRRLEQKDPLPRTELCQPTPPVVIRFLPLLGTGTTMIRKIPCCQHTTV